MATTKHDCGGPVFGRKTPGCPRCDELLAGAAPVSWGLPTAAERRRQAWLDREASRNHHRTCPICLSGRGFCTWGEW